LGTQFDTAIDSGLFHVLSDEEWIVFRRSLSSVLRPNAKYFMLAFSDKGPGWGGPRRISKQEILDTFSYGWRVDFIHRAKFEDAFHGRGGEAWLSGITRQR
jgi:hypothetical protein